MQQEHFHQGEFACGELHHPAVDADGAGEQVQLQGPVAHDAAGEHVAGVPFADPGPDAGHEFLETERLDDIVVGAALQGRDGVGGGGAGREEDDRDAHLAVAQGSQHGETVQAGESDVEEQEIEFAAGAVVHCGDAVGDHGGGEAGGAQTLFDEAGDAFFVFCDEDADQGDSLEKPSGGASPVGEPGGTPRPQQPRSAPIPRQLRAPWCGPVKNRRAVSQFLSCPCKGACATFGWLIFRLLTAPPTAAATPAPNRAPVTWRVSVVDEVQTVRAVGVVRAPGVDDHRVGAVPGTEQRGVVDVAFHHAVLVMDGDVRGERRRDEVFVIGVLHVAEQLRSVFRVKQLAGGKLLEEPGHVRRGQQVLLGIVGDAERRGVVGRGRG